MDETPWDRSENHAFGIIFRPVPEASILKRFASRES